MFYEKNYFISRRASKPRNLCLKIIKWENILIKFAYILNINKVNALVALAYLGSHQACSADKESHHRLHKNYSLDMKDCCWCLDVRLVSTILAFFPPSTSSDAFACEWIWTVRETHPLSNYYRRIDWRCPHSAPPNLLLRVWSLPILFRDLCYLILILNGKIIAYHFATLKLMYDSLKVVNFDWTSSLSVLNSWAKSLILERISINIGSLSRLLSANIRFSVIITSFSFSSGFNWKNKN